LATKLADNTESEGEDGEKREFEHPFVQALGMFLGELLCLAVFYLGEWKKRREGIESPKQTFSNWIFVVPAICDMTATSLMYVGLNMTYASVFQMLRGSVVIFTGLFSVFFLKRKLQRFQWFGMFFVLVGLLCVGVASVMGGDSDANASNPVLGDILIICAQIVVATQMVIEEKYLTAHNVPALQVVGLEGLFGFIGTSFFLLLFYYIPGSNAGNHVENTPDAFIQIYNSWIITVAILGCVLSIAFFNWFGISVTKAMNATTRMVLDSMRTVIIWGFSLIVGWQDFNYVQIIGFVLLLSGTAVYNRVLVLPWAWLKPEPESTQAKQIQEPLLADVEQQNGSEYAYAIDGDDGHHK